jgi:PIN domain nuclease of toxin-antitoxin system
MRVLIDTHVLIWWWDPHPQLSPKAREILETGSNEVFVSAATGTEIAIKVRMGKLPGMKPFLSQFGAAIEADGFRHLAIHHGHAVTAGLMPGQHRDPFDRLIAAQALTEELVVITRDPQFAAFGCKTLW